MTVRLLCVGDIHLGKRPTRIPDGFEISADELGPEVAWSLAVDDAIERRVHAVLMAGDVVERIEDRFHAFGMLVTGARKLQDAGIRTIAVVGNHDVEALPRLARRVEHVELLGAGDERWERTRIIGDGGTEVDVWGWSYHARIERESPLASFSSTEPAPPACAPQPHAHSTLDGVNPQVAFCRDETLCGRHSRSRPKKPLLSTPTP